MLNRLPEFIDPFHLAQKCQGFEGTISFSAMKRLASMLTETDGDAAIDIQFGRDDGGSAIVKGRVTALLHLRCQRCLEPLEFSVDSSFTLGIVSSLRQARDLPQSYEPLVVERTPLSLPELVEDELLLALPAVPMHTEGQCPVKPPEKEATEYGNETVYGATQPSTTKDQGESRQNPFAVLAELKEKLSK